MNSSKPEKVSIKDPATCIHDTLSYGKIVKNDEWIYQQ